MAHALWTGSLSFGLVNIPVRLYAATESHQIAFHQLDSKSGGRIHYKRVSETTGQEVPYAQIVDAYEIKKGAYVQLSDEELAAAEPKKSRTLELEAFVPIDQIDPIAWNHTYYAGPVKGAGGQKAYTLLREAMVALKRVGIGRFVMRSKEYLATVRPLGKLLVIETMFFADEIRPPKEVPLVSDLGRANEREMGLARQLIEALATDWKHASYEDTYRTRLLALIKRKAKGEAIQTAAPTPANDNVVDLMQALRASLHAKASAETKPAKARGKAAKAGRPRLRRARLGAH